MIKHSTVYFIGSFGLVFFHVGTHHSICPSSVVVLIRYLRVCQSNCASSTSVKLHFPASNAQALNASFCSVRKFTVQHLNRITEKNKLHCIVSHFFFLAMQL